MPDHKEALSAASRRSKESRLAILDATRAVLIENGWRKFSVDEVARQAHASKQTIYRRWPAIGVMCVESCLTEIKKPVRDSGDPVDRIPGNLHLHFPGAGGEARRRRLLHMKPFPFLRPKGSGRSRFGR